MSQRVLLVSESKIKEATIIEQNVDSKVLSKIILNVQELHLQPILGKDLYDEILNEVATKAANPSYVISVYNLQLINDYVNPYVIHATLAEFIVLNNFKLSNKGVLRLNDNSASSSSTTDIEYVKNYYDNYAVTYKKRLIDFLHSNNSAGSNTNANISTDTIGWYLEKKYNC